MANGTQARGPTSAQPGAWGVSCSRVPSRRPVRDGTPGMSTGCPSAVVSVACGSPSPAHVSEPPETVLHLLQSVSRTGGAETPLLPPQLAPPGDPGTFPACPLQPLCGLHSAGAWGQVYSLAEVNKRELEDPRGCLFLQTQACCLLARGEPCVDEPPNSPALDATRGQRRPWLLASASPRLWCVVLKGLTQPPWTKGPTWVPPFLVLKAGGGR